jgi:aminoglycoside phosphotransferase (APT) family kinase protein
MGEVDRIGIDAALVRRLVAMQFPAWADLPVTRVQWDGWDNTTFRLGAHMKVRLPSALHYVPQVEKEYRFLPKLAPHLPVPIPVPLAIGVPALGYPWPWSVYRWIDGDIASRERIGDPRQFAMAVAGFLVALQGIDAADGPPAGAHNFFRGGSLAVYDSEARHALDGLRHEIDAAAAAAVWDAALAAPWDGRPVWVHGDISVGNLLVKNGKLSAVIDFGSAAVGDPACDLVIAWTFFEGRGREAFRAGVAADRATWARARGWALWKALITCVHGRRTNPAETAPRRVIDEVITDHRLAH